MKWRALIFVLGIVFFFSLTTASIWVIISGGGAGSQNKLFHYKLNENTGTIVYDETGVYNATYDSVTWTSGKLGFGNATKIPTANDGADTGFKPTEANLDEFSLETLIYVTPSTDAYIFGSADGSDLTDIGWSLKIVKGNITILASNGAAFVLNDYDFGCPPVNDSAWHHVMVTKNNTHSWTMYFDGIFCGAIVGDMNGASVENIFLHSRPSKAVGSTTTTLDNIIWWNSTLNPTEVLYRNNTATEDAELSTVTLDSPIDAFVSSSENITFNISATIIGGANLTNISLWHNGTGTFERNQTIQLDGTTNTTSFTVNTSVPILWTGEACDTDGDCGFATENRTLSIDGITPTINVTTSTIVIYHRLNNNLNISVATTDTNLDVCWYDYSGTNVIYNCNEDLQVNVIAYSNSNITVYVNDTANNINSTFFDWDYKIFSQSQTFPAALYETSSETFSELLTTLNPVTSAELFYDSVSQGSATVTSGGGSNYTISDTLTPTSIGTKSFYWNITTNSEVINGTADSHVVSNANLSLCGGEGGSVSYLNFTFKDESDDSVLNATNDLTDFDYGLSASTQTKSFISSNTTEHFSYAFCFTPSSEDVVTDLTFKYSNTEYPIRTFQLDDQTLTNATTDQTLYLLGSSDGIYSSIQTSEVTGTPISGVTLTIERQFGSVWTVVGVAVGGSDGLATFWVNPNFDHRITAVKTGYVTTQVTITPSQSLYSLVMTKTTGDAEYSGSTEGMSWKTTPDSGYLAPGATYFTFNLTANYDNLDGGFCKFELVNGSQDILNSTTGGSSGGCNLSLWYTHLAGERLYGKLYVDTTNTTGYILIDADLRWTDIEGTNVNPWKTMFNFFTELKDIDEWGVGQHRQEWNRTVLFFLALTISIGIFSFFTQWDAQYPGAAMFLVSIVIIFASFSGWFNIENVALAEQGLDKINKYMIGFMTTAISAAWYVGYLRRTT